MSLPIEPDTTGLALSHYVAGFEAGYAAGQVDGYRQGEAVEAETWCIAFGGLVTAAMATTQAELERRRRTLPEDTDCLCGSCRLRRTAVRRRGGDYPGASGAVAGAA